MFYKFARIIAPFIICISCATSSHNILPSELNGTGVLVVPQTATAENIDTGIDFAYCYILSCRPKTDLNLKIIPSTSKSFALINNFPPGNYIIDGFTWEGIASGISGGGGLAFGSGTFNRIPPTSFEIKPNTITVLDRIFETKTKEATGGSTQYFNMSYLNTPERETLLEELKNLENFDMWEIDY